MTERGRWTIIVVALLIIIVWVAYTAARLTGLVEFEPFTVEEFTQQMAGLFLVTLFVERVLEVFISGTRGPEERMLERAVEEVTPKVVEAATAQEGQNAGSRQSNPQPEPPALTVAKNELALYRTKTRRIAFAGSVLLGLAAGAVGVRALSLFIDLPQFEDLPLSQQQWFQGFDVILTAGLIAGGSDGMHQLVETFTGYLQKVKDNQKGQTSV